MLNKVYIGLHNFHLQTKALSSHWLFKLAFATDARLLGLLFMLLIFFFILSILKTAFI